MHGIDDGKTVRHLPVMDEEKIIGMATIGDLVVATIKV
jgi:CBS domain-containing protein